MDYKEKVAVIENYIKSNQSQKIIPFIRAQIDTEERQRLYVEYARKIERMLKDEEHHA